jgi:hypothetical protein
MRKEEPAVSSIAHRGYIHVGMDVSKETISVAVLPPDRDRIVSVLAGVGAGDRSLVAVFMVSPRVVRSCARRRGVTP